MATPAKRRRTSPTVVHALGTSGASINLGALGRAGGSALTATEKARLKEAAEILAVRIREVALTRSRGGGHAERMAASVRVSVTARGVFILAGNASEPLSKQFELGKYHPLFGMNGKGVGRFANSVWKKQPLFPFMELGAFEGLDAAAEEFANVINDWLDELGVGK